MDRVCFVCQKENSNKLCGRCKDVRYCSFECQKKDWNTHKINCKVFEIQKEHEQKLKRMLETSGNVTQGIHTGFPDIEETNYYVCFDMYNQKGNTFSSALESKYFPSNDPEKTKDISFYLAPWNGLLYQFVCISKNEENLQKLNIIAEEVKCTLKNNHPVCSFASGDKDLCLFPVKMSENIFWVK